MGRLIEKVGRPYTHTGGDYEGLKGVSAMVRGKDGKAGSSLGEVAREADVMAAHAKLIEYLREKSKPNLTVQDARRILAKVSCSLSRYVVQEREM